MKLNELKYTEGSRKNGYKVGRGVGSGNGKTSGAGQKGQKSRSGGHSAPGFEGGQTTLYRRLPKFGFTHYGQKKYAIVNLKDLSRFKEGTVVNPALLKEEGIVKFEYDGVKILGVGELKVKLTVQADKFSKSAEEAIKKAGGTVEVLK